jgi:protein-L-isoaspartate(D-aspartate) O-methyltransferase
VNITENITQLIAELQKHGVTNTAVLNAIKGVPREIFMSQPFKSRAYENVALPIGLHQTISQPLVVGLMTQALEVTDRTKVLEIGTGSGYQTSVLSPLCRRIYSVERHPQLHDEAEARFKILALTNITAIIGDGSKGWPQQAPFERIMVTAAAEDVPLVLLEQLAIGGIMIIPIGVEAKDQRLVRVTRTNEGAETMDLGAVRFVPLLPGVAEK